MKPRSWTLVLGMLGLAAMLAAKVSAQKDEPATPEGVEVLARGPVHEGFAVPSQTRPLPSQVVPNKPPDPINEVPPDEKPAGDHVTWLPGYWAWDDEQKNYLWVSGFWRVPPPDRQWVPGNWQQVEDGWQWTSGFWAAGDQQEVTYLPAPPPSVDEGPSTPAPDDNGTYVPGCWIHRETHYLWRPGFWLGYQTGLGLGSGPLRVDPGRLRLRGWLLGPAVRTARPALCPNQCGALLIGNALDLRPPIRGPAGLPHGGPVCPAIVLSLLFWRLL